MNSHQATKSGRIISDTEALWDMLPSALRDRSSQGAITQHTCHEPHPACLLARHSLRGALGLARGEALNSVQNQRPA